MIRQAERIESQLSIPAEDDRGVNEIKRRGRLLRRLAIFQRDHWRCVYCGRNLAESFDEIFTATLDHIQPLAEGGASSIENLATCCKVCNALKGSTPISSIEAGRRIVNERRKFQQEKYLAELEGDEVAIMAARASSSPLGADIRTIEGQTRVLTRIMRKHAAAIGQLSKDLRTFSGEIEKQTGARFVPARPPWKRLMGWWFGR